jgi:hypothetical protein
VDLGLTSSSRCRRAGAQYEVCDLGLFILIFGNSFILLEVNQWLLGRLLLYIYGLFVQDSSFYNFTNYIFSFSILTDYVF